MQDSPITEGDGDGAELVQVAFANEAAEAGMIQGLLESDGIPSLLQASGFDGTQLGYAALRSGYSGPQRIMVRADHFERAKGLLADVLVEGELEAEPEIANARHLDDALGRRGPREYGVVGAFARFYLVAAGAMAIAFGLFLLLRVV